MAYSFPQVNPAAVAALHGDGGARFSRASRCPDRASDRLGVAAQAESAQMMAAYQNAPFRPSFAQPGYDYAPLSPLGEAAMEADAEGRANGERYGRSLNPNSSIEMVVARLARIPVGRMEIEAYKSAEEAQKKLDQDVAAITAYNAPIHSRNQKVVLVLEAATGQTFGEDQKAWTAWIVDQIGYGLIQAQATARETVVDTVLPYQTRVPIEVSDRAIRYNRVSCFAAGTLVRTLDGDRPIESLNVGDLVLSQDEASGALSYQPILMVHRNPPAATLKIDLANDSILASTYHRFWKPGQGWVMARELKPGDRLRTVGGVATIKEIAAEKVQPVFNLDVAESRTFFVGKSGTLAHDNSVPDRRATPFDAASAD